METRRRLVRKGAQARLQSLLAGREGPGEPRGKGSRPSSAGRRRVWVSQSPLWLGRKGGGASNKEPKGPQFPFGEHSQSFQARVQKRIGSTAVALPSPGRVCISLKLSPSYTAPPPHLSLLSPPRRGETEKERRRMHYFSE